MPKRREGRECAHLPEDHLDALLIYATYLMIAMGLPTYRILIMEKRANKGSIAEIKTTDNRYVANLYLCKDWLDQPDNVKRETITHEVLHLWHRELSDWFNSEVWGVLQSHDYIRLDRQFTHITELMVDNIAMILADTQRLKEVWEEAHGGAPVGQVLETTAIAD